MKNCYVFLFSTLFSLSIYAQQSISVQHQPAAIFKEKGEHEQHLNFDFRINNLSSDTLTLTKISCSAYTVNDQLLYQYFLDNNGTAPSIEIIPKRVFPGKSTHLLFNPFSDFESTLNLTRLNYEFIFTDPSDHEFVIKDTIHPLFYDQHLNFSAPVKGRFLVYDGHDFYSHHRRFDYEFPFIKELGLSSNFMRYAYDFVLLNDANKYYETDGKKDEDYKGFGQPVFAVCDGKVIYATGEHEDDKNFDVKKLLQNPLELYGNCIAIEHPNGSVSIYGHLKKNSISVKVGDVVKSKQEIARIGVSGSSFFPHLHFEVRTSIKNDAEGLPSFFSNLKQIKGKVVVPVKSGLAETGMIYLSPFQ